MEFFGLLKNILKLFKNLFVNLYKNKDFYKFLLYGFFVLLVCYGVGVGYNLLFKCEISFSSILLLTILGLYGCFATGVSFFIICGLVYCFVILFREVCKIIISFLLDNWRKATHYVYRADLKNWLQKQDKKYLKAVNFLEDNILLVSIRKIDNKIVVGFPDYMVKKSLIKNVDTLLKMYNYKSKRRDV
jgi:hypothetical protein